MLRVTRYFVIAAICFGFIVGAAQARDLKVSLPFLPPLVETKEKGILVDLCKAMAEEYKDGKITWDVVPFPRSLDNVEKGRADLHMPFIVPKHPQKMPFQYSSEVIDKIMFVLYTNKNNKDINPKNLAKYKVEGADIFVGEVPNLVPSTLVDSALQKVDVGRIDAFLYAMPETDMALKKLGLKNIKRWEYGKYDAKALLPLGEKGKEVDKIFSGLIKKLKASGRYQQIMGPILDQKYENWQP